MFKYLIYNILNLVCFTLLAIVFDKWWIILLALLFLCVPSSKFKGQRFRVCDSCGRWSESGATDTEAIIRAEKCGWIHIEEGNKDFCPECREKIKGNNKND